MFFIRLTSIMPEASFKPYRIFVDRSVENLPLTQRVLRKFPSVPVERVDDPKTLKKPAPMTKKNLLLTQMKADPIKEFGAMSKSARRPYYSLDLISNCHLECTYCILQSYLENNPLITVYTNIEEILERLGSQMIHLPIGSVIGTGRIADSLALDGISEHNRLLVPFFGRSGERARQASPLLELKTKSNRIDGLLGLNHGGQTVVSWSMNPSAIIEREEYKTASFEERIKAAQRVLEAGYPVGFHFDPMIFHEEWKRNYTDAVKKLFRKIPDQKIAWVSVGTLRFPARQGRIMEKRFPKNLSIHEGLLSTHHTFLHYPDSLREEMQSWMQLHLSRHLPAEKVYRCMDF